MWPADSLRAGTSKVGLGKALVLNRRSADLTTFHCALSSSAPIALGDHI